MTNAEIGKRIVNGIAYDEQFTHLSGTVCI